MQYEPEEIQIGKTVLRRSRLGSISFINKRGVEVSFDSYGASQLFEAVRDGYTKKSVNVISHGTADRTNVEKGAPLQASGDGLTGYFGFEGDGGMPTPAATQTHVSDQGNKVTT